MSNYIVFKNNGHWEYEEFRGFMYPFAVVFKAFESEVKRIVRLKNESK